jgi:hypothetical protein
MAMKNLATTRYVQGDLVGARNLQEQVLAVSRRVLGEEHPDTLTAMNNLAQMTGNGEPQKISSWQRLWSLISSRKG